jgi:hypothetical protein
LWDNELKQINAKVEFFETISAIKVVGDWVIVIIPDSQE